MFDQDLDLRAALAAAAGRAIAEVDRALLDPVDEFLDLLVGEQLLDRIVVAREFGFGEYRVDF